MESQVTETNLAVEKKVEMMSDNLEHQTEYPVVLPVLPLRNIVVFPGMIVPLFVGREKSIRALEDVMANDKDMLLVTQKDGDQDDPQSKDMHQIGTIGSGFADAETAGWYG